MKILHIVQGYSARGTFRRFLKETNKAEEVLAFPTDFKHGAIFKDFSDDELQKRFLYLKTLYKDCDELTYETIHNFVNHDFNQYEKIVVWHGNNVDEWLLLYMMCALIKKDIYEVDVEELKSHFSRLRHSPFLSLSCCSEENIIYLYDRIKPISNCQKQEYASQWERWSQSDAPIRIMDNQNNIVEVGEDYFDESLLSDCTTEYKMVARVIGETLYDTLFLVGDFFLHKRIIHLISINKLSAIQNEEFAKEIEVLSHSDEEQIIINGVNVTEMRFYSVRRAD